MPTYKHPCPHCSKYIERDVAACPFCGTADPFAPGRCPNCSAVIEDRAWLACPKCGTALTGVVTPQQASQPPASGARPVSAGPATALPAARTCTGCGAPLAEGARFCTVCGTLAS